MTIKQIVLLVVLVASVAVLLRNQLKGVWTWFGATLKAFGSKLTNEQAQGIADTLKESFANFIPFNSYNTVLSLLGEVSMADYYKIKASFGLVARDFTGAPAEDITKHIYTDKNLTEWLMLELSDVQKASLKSKNSIFTAIL